jgi:hypothetical protein
MAESTITGFPIQSKARYAEKAGTRPQSEDSGIARAYSSSIPKNSLECSEAATASEKAVAAAVASTLAVGNIRTAHAASGHAIDAGAVVANGSDKFKCRSLISTTPETLTISYGGTDSNEINLIAQVKSTGGLMWENDDGKLSTATPGIFELFTFDDVEVDEVIFGNRKRTPMRCVGNIGGAAGGDRTSKIVDDFSMDINSNSSEYAKISRRSLDFDHFFKEGVFTISIKFQSNLPAAAYPIGHRMNLWKYYKSNVGIKCEFEKTSPRTWKMACEVNTGTADHAFDSDNWKIDGVVVNENFLDNVQHTLHMVSEKTLNGIKISVGVDGFIRESINHEGLSLWMNPIESTFILCDGNSYNGSINDLYMFNERLSDEQLRVLPLARYTGGRADAVVKTVQGGIHQKTALVDLASVDSDGRELFSLKAGEIIGKIFVKVISGVACAEQGYSLGVAGTSSTKEKYAKNINFLYEVKHPGLYDGWVYGDAFNFTEAPYVAADETVKLFLSFKDDANAAVAGKLAVTMFYDRAIWSPSKLYCMGSMNAGSADNQVLKLDLSTEHLGFSSRCSGISTLRYYGAASWNGYIFCAGGLDSVKTDDSSNPKYSDLAASIYKYDTVNDHLSPMVRCQLSSERRGCGKIGLVSYSMVSGGGRTYFFGGCVNHGQKKFNTAAGSVYAEDYYETLNTVDKFNPNVDSLNAVANAKMSEPRVGGTSFSVGGYAYVVGGVKTYKGQLIDRPNGSSTIWNATADTMNLAVDTLTTFKAHDDLGSTSGASKAGLTAPNGSMYLVGGGRYATGNSIETSAATCHKFSGTTFTSFSTGDMIYASSRTCRGQDPQYGWIAGGVQSNGTTSLPIQWVGKFNFATETFSVSSATLPEQGIDGSSGESV